MFDTVSLFAKLCHNVSNLEVIHPDKPVRKLYHRREKKKTGFILISCNVSNRVY